MVLMKNIKRDGNIIQCNFFPNCSAEPGFLSVDLTTEKVIEGSLPKGYEHCTKHAHQTLRRLLEIQHEPVFLDTEFIVSLD